MQSVVLMAQTTQQQLKGTFILLIKIRYNTKLNKWDFVASMKSGRCMVQAIVSECRNGIYVMGGFNNQPVKTIEYYDSLQNKWSITEFENSRRYMHSAIIA